MDIKKRREELEILQADLAIACGVSERTIQAWERGTTRNIKPENMKKLLVALGLRDEAK